MFCVRSASLTFRLKSSVGLTPVSRLTVSFRANVFPDSAIIISIFSCVGIPSSLLSSLNLGLM